MLNSNENPTKRELPAPAIPLIVLAIWVGLWLFNDFVYDLPKGADLIVIVLSAVLFFSWCFGAFEKKGQ